MVGSRWGSVRVLGVSRDEDQVGLVALRKKVEELQRMVRWTEMGGVEGLVWRVIMGPVKLGKG